MSKADFTAQQAAIAPAVTELGKPEIKAGQVWRTRGGLAACVRDRTIGPYPWRVTSGDGCTGWAVNESGIYNAGDAGLLDLAELIKDENGFTIWRGGEQPKETRGKVIVFRLCGDARAEIGPRNADILEWGRVDAYKVLSEESAKESIKIEMPAAAPVFGIDPSEDCDNRHVVPVEIPPGYDKLFAVLMQAFEQASGGKGKERHAKDGVPFEDQPMSQINKQLGSIDGFIYQAHKKSLESKRLPDGRGQAELLGAIVYLAGAVIARDTWAAESLPKD